MRHRSWAVLALIAASAAPGAAYAQDTEVVVEVTGLRSSKGMVRACLTAQAEAFPNCDKDPHARKLNVAAAPEVRLDFGAVPEGRYAIAVIHDENGNGKLDTTLMIPREGFGFSRDAPVHMSAPHFDKAAFDVPAQAAHLTLKMRYLL
ncbi:hypothetical protein WSK_3683 [Novosphingobium sp. Rr 2-17]|uniref:DUF2141 domain-containing protein n=1 Tax=Novosphingobium sp. Rr 2-17 TaxID=555793 RepID=UPI0002697EF0|nr:DUF2141 domain-containing protein [Novosphingobium sp. Rr 2-17]EIZ77674.1 hypothetical protein WSK_3683 [Novosphingobium sp. Rr 2-17]